MSILPRPAGCGCPCHTIPGVAHAVACCNTPPASVSEPRPDGRAEQLARYEKHYNEGHPTPFVDCLCAEPRPDARGPRRPWQCESPCVDHPQEQCQRLAGHEDYSPHHFFDCDRSPAPPAEPRPDAAGEMEQVIRDAERAGLHLTVHKKQLREYAPPAERAEPPQPLTWRKVAHLSDSKYRVIAVGDGWDVLSDQDESFT